MQEPSKVIKPETTGEAAKELKPGEGQNVRNNQAMPSSPPAANKCSDGKPQERSGPEQRCP
jgi:hypothetical protein